MRSVRAVFAVYLVVIVLGHRLRHRAGTAGPMTARVAASSRTTAEPGVRRRCSWSRWSGRRSPGTADYNAQQVADGLEPVSLLRVRHVVDLRRRRHGELAVGVPAVLPLHLRAPSGWSSAARRSPRSRARTARSPTRSSRSAATPRRTPRRGRAPAAGGRRCSPGRSACSWARSSCSPGRLVDRRLGGLQQRAARRAAGPGQLARLPRRGRLLEPVLPELAVGDARRRLDGGLLRLPAPAGVAGVQARRRRRTPRPARPADRQGPGRRVDTSACRRRRRGAVALLDSAAAGARLRR